MKPAFLSFLWLAILIPSFSALADEADIARAYQSIPHRQTRFDPAAANLPDVDKRFLDEFFSLSDLALVERVDFLASGGDGGHYDDILRRLSDLPAPPQAEAAQRLLVAAIQDQKTYLERVRAGETRFDINDPLVESAHRRLIQAYGVLMRAYPSETGHNQQAFYDHLCALDFK